MNKESGRPERRGQLNKSNKKDFRKRKSEKSEADGIRLNKYIANAGICSRREADELIKSGDVRVNGKAVSELGTRVKFKDKVVVKGKTISAERKVYILLNKPKDFVTTTKDEFGRKSVMDLIKHAGNQRVYPVGRLDRNTTGVLLLTNDGELSEKLTHPKYNRKKIYHITLDKPLTKHDFETIANGVELEDGYIKPDAMSYVAEKDLSQLGIEIHSGRNRIVRRIFEHLEYQVKKLDRVSFAGLTKKNVPRGKWRFLNEKEIAFLKISAGNRKK